VLEEEAAKQRAGRRPDAADACPQADRLRPLASAEGRRDDRQRRRGEERCAEPHDRAGSDDGVGVVAERAGERPGAEDGGPEEEDPPPPVAVAERRGEEDEHAVRQRVAVGDPRQAARARVEVADQGGQGDIQDRLVKRDQKDG
jgi:hypothetical protein